MRVVCFNLLYNLLMVHWSYNNPGQLVIKLSNLKILIIKNSDFFLRFIMIYILYNFVRLKV